MTARRWRLVARVLLELLETLWRLHPRSWLSWVWRDLHGPMLELALRAPRKAEKRWQRLMDTDGLRGRWDEKTGTFKLFRKSGGW